MLRAGFVPVLCARESRTSLQGHPWLAPCSGLSSMLLSTARHVGVNKTCKGPRDPGPPSQAASCRTAVRLRLEGWLRHNPSAWERRARVNSDFQVREVCINKPDRARLLLPDNKHLQTVSLS